MISQSRTGSLARLLILSLFLTPIVGSKPIQAQDKTKEGGKLHYVLNVGPTLEVNQPYFRVSGLPEIIRNVPKHPEDTYAPDRNMGPIKDTPLSSPPVHFNISSSAGIGYQAGSVDIDAGAALAYRLLSSARINRRNYTNAVGTDERGVGAALTYCGFMDRVNGYYDLVPGVFFQVSKNVGEPDGYTGEVPRFFIRYDLETFEANAVTGYDRWNQLDNLENFPLGKIISHSIKSGYEVKGPNFVARAYAGYAFTKAHPNDLGKESGLRADNAIVGGVELLFGKH